MAESPVGNAKKVFFLYFPPDAENHLIKKIASHEYEVYHIPENFEPYIDIIRNNPQSIIFSYGNNAPPKVKWEDQYGLLNDCFGSLGVKISTWSREDSSLKLVRDLTNFETTIDHIDVNLGYPYVQSLILEFLKRHEARGRRTFVRIQCMDEYSATFSIKLRNTISAGSILDISTIAMACSFSASANLPCNYYIEDIQLRLASQTAHLSGTVFSKRTIDGKTVYVILFDIKKNPEIRLWLSEYIYMCLQKKIRMQNDKG